MPISFDLSRGSFLKETALIIAAYLIGSIPTGLLLAKAWGVDIRSTGSGNIGATNVYRTVGRKLGLLTLLGDCLKGLLPVLAAKALGLSLPMVAAVALAAFLGHVYTVFLGFKGGKGVATALGVFLGISPLSILCAFAVFALVLYRSSYVSLASITAAAIVPVIITVATRQVEFVAMSVVVAAIVIYRHKENINRLRAGTENKFRA